MRWKTVNVNHNYEVSNTGLVRHVSGELIGQWLNDQGYSIVRLSKPRAQYRVHRLVASAFVENPSRLPYINHLDHCRSNNGYRNLEWCTQKENIRHARHHGRMADTYWKGRRSPNASLTDEQVAAIRKEYARGGISWERLSKKHGTSKRVVGRIIKGESYM